jgi:hypothetical protein
LIELAVVTLLVVLLISISSPLFRRSLSDLALRDSSFNIARLINYGQEKAVIERKNFKITFDFENRRYQLLELDESAETPSYKRMAGRFGRPFTLPQGISFEDSKREVVLYPDGHCDELELKLSDRRGEGYVVKISGPARSAAVERRGARAE